MGKYKRYARRFYRFVFYGDSILSWIVNVVLAFIVVKFLVYPGLSLLLGTQLPLVAVISGSMEHEGLSFEDWWAENGEWYEEQGISKEMFESYSFDNGFDKGDVIILVGESDVEVGDVLVYSSVIHPYPIIHRVIYINDEENLYEFKGDNNPGVDQSPVYDYQVIGRAWFKIPKIGWIKIWSSELIGI